MPPGNADTFPPFACHCAPARCYANTWQIFACHCEERSDVAIRTPCSGAEREAILWANPKSTTNLPEQQPACQAPLRGRGLPRRGAAAPLLAMTCRGRVSVRGCKDVVRNDRLGRCVRICPNSSQLARHFCGDADCHVAGRLPRSSQCHAEGRCASAVARTWGA